MLHRKDNVMMDKEYWENLYDNIEEMDKNSHKDNYNFVLTDVPNDIIINEDFNDDIVKYLSLEDDLINIKQLIYTACYININITCASDKDLHQRLNQILINMIEEVSTIISTCNMSETHNINVKDSLDIGFKGMYTNINRVRSLWKVFVAEYKLEDKESNKVMKEIIKFKHKLEDILDK